VRKEPEPLRSWTWPHQRLTCRGTSSLMRLCGGYDVYGVENVPKEGALIAANHISYVDPPVVAAALPRRTYFVAKRELFEIPLFGWFIRKNYAFPVERSSADRTAMRHAVRLLQAGELVTMFPGGERSPDGSVQEGLPGVAFIAQLAGVGIIPCALKGTEQVLPRRAWYLHRGKVAVRFGEPIYVGSPEPGTGRKATVLSATETVMHRIAEMRDELYEMDGETPPDKRIPTATSI